MVFCVSLISLEMSESGADVLVGECRWRDGKRSWSVELYAGESPRLSTER